MRRRSGRLYFVNDVTELASTTVLTFDDLRAGDAGLAAFSQLGAAIEELDVSLTRAAKPSPRKRSILLSLISASRHELEASVVCEGVGTLGSSPS